MLNYCFELSFIKATFIISRAFGLAPLLHARMFQLRPFQAGFQKLPSLAGFCFPGGGKVGGGGGGGGGGVQLIWLQKCKLNDVLCDRPLT